MKLRFGLIATFVVTMILNGLAGSTRLLGGMQTGEVSDSYPNLFAPSGVTFSIWGVIYLLLVGFIVYTWGMGRAKKSALSTEALGRVVQLLIVNLMLNSVWILAWQYKVFWLSVLLIVGMLVTLIQIVTILKNIQLPAREYALAKLPFSIYFGWITVATIANITTWLVSINWNGWGIRDGIWTVAVLIVGATIALITALHNHDAAYLTVFVWAYAGILLKHLSPNGFDGRYPSTIVTLAILLGVFISTVIMLAMMNKKPVANG